MLHSAVTLSERYITERYLPDKAIDLIDEAAAQISLSSPEINEKRELADKRTVLQKEADAISAKAAEGETDEETFKRLADIKVDLLRLEERYNAVSDACELVEMTVQDLAQVIETWTGIPASTIHENEYERLARLEENLSSRIIGQSEAVSAVARAIRRNRVGVSYKRKPVSFIFAGPTGVGRRNWLRCWPTNCSPLRKH